jgi:amidase
MANSMSGIKIFTKAIIDSHPWIKDPLVVRKEWSQKEYELCYHGGGKEPLCFGIMWDNGVVRPSPPLIRAMEITKEALERKGHKGGPIGPFGDKS